MAAQTLQAGVAGVAITPKVMLPIGSRPYTVNAKKIPLISVRGNNYVDPQGNVVLFPGLAISDPNKLEMPGHWSKDHFVADKVGYVTHPCEIKRPKPWGPKWEEDFGFAAGRYPIIATEFGGGGRPGVTVAPDSYMPSIIKYLEGEGIS